MKVGTLKLLLDIMSHLASNMPHIAPFEGSKGHGAPSDVRYLRTDLALRCGTPHRKPASMALRRDVMGGLHRLWLLI